jgi:predicted nucleic acid-binding protein
MADAESLTITERIVACRDPADHKFLELAINGHADLIVSGDADLLALNPFGTSLSSRPPILWRASRDSSLFLGR